MNNAPLYDLPDQPAPAGGQAWFAHAGDGIALRLALWRAPTPARGTAILAGGRTEFIEKYADAALALTQRGFDVLSFDWRGQGLSDRLLPDRAKGHVDRFGSFQRDLSAVLTEAARLDLPRPWIGVAHSMGGHNFLRHAVDTPATPFVALALSAPMCAVVLPKPEGVLKAIVRMAARIAPSAYAFGQGPSVEESFANNTLTSDAARFAVMVAAWARDPHLALGGVTFGWLNAALTSMDHVLTPGRLEAVKIPILIASARADKIVVPQVHDQVVARLSQGRLLAIEGARHEILREADRYRDQFWTAFDRLIAERL